MDVEKWFNEQKIKPVQDRKDGMDYWKNYELFTWNDVTECLQAMKELCEGNQANSKNANCAIFDVRKPKGTVCDHKKVQPYFAPVDECEECGELIRQ